MSSPLDARELHRRRLSDEIGKFEGVIYTTSELIVDRGVEMDFDDVRQFLRVKVWAAIERYDPARSRLPFDRFVFGCIWNAKLDLLKRPRRYNESVEELRAERQDSLKFDAKYLATTDDEEIFEGQAAENILSDLSPLERQVVELRSTGLMLAEIEAELGLAPGQVQSTMRAVRKKLAHLRPKPRGQRTGPMRPLPAAEPQSARPPAALAA